MPWNDAAGAGQRLTVKRKAVARRRKQVDAKQVRAGDCGPAAWDTGHFEVRVGVGQFDRSSFNVVEGDELHLQS